MADMRVTDSHDIRRGYPFAALKNVILSPEVLVATAGNSDLAMHTLRELPPQPRDHVELLPLLLDSCRRAGGEQGDVAYLVAVAGRGLWRVTHSGIEAEQSASWIGDPDAFELYQRAYHEMPVFEPIWVPGISPVGSLPIEPEDLAIAMRMSNAIFGLQTGPSVESIGEAFISSTSSSTGFRYDQQAHLAADHEQAITSSEWVRADWGTSAEGGFGYSTLIPTQPGIGIVGLYFPHAALGLLYHPLKQDDAFVFRQVTHAEFQVGVRDDHGVQIGGPRVR